MADSLVGDLLGQARNSGGAMGHEMGSAGSRDGLERRLGYYMFGLSLHQGYGLTWAISNSLSRCDSSRALSREVRS